MDRAALARRALALVKADPALGGLITVGYRAEVDGGRRIPPGAALTGYRSPWGWQPGLLDTGGLFAANLDLLAPLEQAAVAAGLDAGRITLVASAEDGPPPALLADRVAFLLPPVPPALPPTSRRTVSLGLAVRTIAGAAAAWRVEGHRAEWFALRAALAMARLAGRRRLTEADVAEAVLLVLAPRARAVPEESAADANPPTRQDATQQQDTAEAPPLPAWIPPLPPAPVHPRPAQHGAPGRTVPGRRRLGSPDLPATLLAALPMQRLRGREPGALPPAVRPEDLRWRLHRPRLGRLVVFLVDSSGSMGRRRLGQAKGAVLSLLEQAYRKRDQVAVILAGGQTVRLLLAPTRALDQARRALTAVPAGGATPLAGGLLLARDLARRAHTREGRPCLLLLLTDGRANQPHDPGREPGAELKDCARLLRLSRLPAAVLSEPGAEARQLARWLGAPILPVGGLNRPTLPSFGDL